MAGANDRFIDDISFAPGGIITPQAAGQLFDQLGVEQAAKTTQESALRNWLSDNTPSPTLTRSLIRKGFGDLLEAKQSA